MALDANEDIDFEAHDGYESDGSDEDGDQPVATLNSVLQRLEVKGKKKGDFKKVLMEGETPSTRMTLERIYKIVHQLKPEIKDEAIFIAFKDVVKKESQPGAGRPRNLPAEYVAAMTNPPNPSAALVGEARNNYLRFLQTRDQVRVFLGIDEINARRWVVAWVDAGANAQKLADYLGIACHSIETEEVDDFACVILYGHTSYAPWPNRQNGTNPDDPRMGQGKLYTPHEIWKRLGEPEELVVIGCNSRAFTAALNGEEFHKIRILFTTQPFHWQKAGNQCPEFILAQDSNSKRIFGTLIDILQ